MDAILKIFIDHYQKFVQPNYLEVVTSPRYENELDKSFAALFSSENFVLSVRASNGKPEKINRIRPVTIVPTIREILDNGLAGVKCFTLTKYGTHERHVHSIYSALACAKGLRVKQAVPAIIKRIFAAYLVRREVYQHSSAAVINIMHYMGNINVEQSEGWNAVDAIKFQRALFAILSLILLLKNAPSVPEYTTLNLEKVYLDIVRSPFSRIISFKESSGKIESSLSEEHAQKFVGVPIRDYELEKDSLGVNQLFMNIQEVLLPALRDYCIEMSEFYANIMLYNKREIPFRRILTKNLKTFLEKANADSGRIGQ